MAEPSPPSAQSSVLQLYNIAAAISPDLASDFARLAGFSVTVPELAPIVEPLKRIDAWSQEQTSHRESCRNLLHKALKIVVLISERSQDGRTNPSELSPTIEQTVTSILDINYKVELWTLIPLQMSSRWQPRIEAAITKQEEQLKSFFDHLSVRTAFDRIKKSDANATQGAVNDGTTASEWKVEEGPVDHWVPGDMEEPVHGDSQPGLSGIVEKRLSSEIPETTDKEDDRPPVPGHSRNPTFQGREDGISHVDSFQPNYPANQGVGGAADLEKWTNFITVVPGQDGWFKIKTGARAIYGGFSDVWEGDAKFSDRTTVSVAVKKFRAVRIPPDADVTSRLLKRLKKELRIWMNLKHRNIAPLLGFDLSGDLCTISRWYLNGSVESYITQHPEADRIKLVSDVACGLSYLHNRAPPVVHGDMKPDNVLVDDTGDAVIIDFGLSSVMETEPTLATSFASASLQDAGNPRWMAPELLMEEGCARSLSTDIYSFGCVTLYIYTGEIPFKGIPDRQVIPALFRAQKPVTTRDDYPAVSATDAEWLYRLLVSCWDAKPSSRPSMRIVEERVRSGDTTKGIDVMTAQHRSSPALPKTTSTTIPVLASPSLSAPKSDSTLTRAVAPPSSTSASTPSAPPQSMAFGSNTARRALATTPSRNQRLEPYTSKMSAPSAPDPLPTKQTSAVQLFDIPVVVSAEPVFDAARLVARCAPVPGLAPVVETLRIIFASVERLYWNKSRCHTLTTDAMKLVFVICDYYENKCADTSKLQTVVEQVVRAIRDIEVDARALAEALTWTRWDISPHEVDLRITKHEETLKSLTEYISLAATRQIHDKVVALQEVKTTSTAIPVPVNPSSSPLSDSSLSPTATPPSPTSAFKPSAPSKFISSGSNTTTRTLPRTPSRNQILEPYTSKMPPSSAPHPPPRKQTSVVQLFDILVVVSAEQVFDVARLAARCAPVPGLAPVVETLRIIFASVERLSWNKSRCHKLTIDAMKLVFVICDHYENERADTPKLQTAVERVVRAIRDIEVDARALAEALTSTNWDISPREVDLRITKHEETLKSLTEYISLAATRQIHDKVAALKEVKATSTAIPVPVNPSSSPLSNSSLTPMATLPSATSAFKPSAPSKFISSGSNTATRTLPRTPSTNQILEPYTSKMSASSAPRPPPRRRTPVVQLFDIPVVVSAETVFDAARLAACCAPVPRLAPVVETLRIIFASVERVPGSRSRCRELSTRAMTLVFIICDHYDNEREETPKLQTAIEKTVQAMHDIDVDVRAWAAVSFWKSWYSRRDVEKRITEHEEKLKNITESLSLAATVQIHDKVAALQESLKNNPSGSADRKRAEEQLYRLRNAPPGELAALTPPELACECVRLGSQPEYSGTTNDVWKGRWLDKQDVALIFYKEYKMGARDDDGIRRFERQIKVWRRLDNLYVLRLCGWCKFDGETYLVSPWLRNRDVLKYLDRDRGRHKKCLALITEIALGLRYLHSQDIIHGSLKPSNILVQDDGRAVLSDFSLARLPTWVWQDTMIELDINIYRYRAPEVILEEPISKASDVYSWAMTALEIITGDPPFHTWRSGGQLVAQVIMQSRIPNRSDYNSPVLDKHPEIWNLFVRSWNRQAAERPTAKEIVEVLESIPVNAEY